MKIIMIIMIVFLSACDGQDQYRSRMVCDSFVSPWVVHKRYELRVGINQNTSLLYWTDTSGKRYNRKMLPGEICHKESYQLDT